MRGPLGWTAVACGGAIGSAGRYAADSWVGLPEPGAWPWATFLVNVVGCLLLGALLGLIRGDERWDVWRPFLGVGVLGGFTTYSAFAVESVDLLSDGALGLGATYVATTLVLGIAAVWLGQRLATS